MYLTLLALSKLSKNGYIILDALLFAGEHIGREVQGTEGRRRKRRVKK